MKTPDCPICQAQILRIMKKFDKLSVCNVTFLVLSPPPIEKLYKAKEKTLLEKDCLLSILRLITFNLIPSII